jgi:hypothetical protein
MTFEHRSSFLPSAERGPHYTTTGIPHERWSFASALSLALPNLLFPLLVTTVGPRRRHPTSHVRASLGRSLQ